MGDSTASSPVTSVAEETSEDTYGVKRPSERRKYVGGVVQTRDLQGQIPSSLECESTPSYCSYPLGAQQLGCVYPSMPMAGTPCPPRITERQSGARRTVAHVAGALTHE